MDDSLRLHEKLSLVEEHLLSTAKSGHSDLYILIVTSIGAAELVVTILLIAVSLLSSFKIARSDGRLTRQSQPPKALCNGLVSLLHSLISALCSRNSFMTSSSAFAL